MLIKANFDLRKGLKKGNYLLHVIIIEDCGSNKYSNLHTQNNEDHVYLFWEKVFNNWLFSIGIYVKKKSHLYKLQPWCLIYYKKSSSFKINLEKLVFTHENYETLTILKSKYQKIYSKWETSLNYFYRYLTNVTNVTLNKYLWVEAWDVIFYNTFKSTVMFFFTR